MVRDCCSETIIRGGRCKYFLAILGGPVLQIQILGWTGVTYSNIGRVGILQIQI